MIAASLLFAAAMSVATPESQGVPSHAIEAWIAACERELDAVHGFVLMRHGKIIAEGSWRPYETLTRPHTLYSHSKAFTSTAIGFLVDDGSLDLDARVVDIFPDKLPESVSENLRAVRVRDLLTMNYGAPSPDAERNDIDGDWEKALLATPITAKPGQKFLYDSGATYLLACIVERISKQPMMAFLEKRLFSRIGIENAVSGVSPSGTPCGGWGMKMTTHDLARFGQLYLNRGVWNGERLLSSDWITLASSRQTWSGAIAVANEDGSDWHLGYGFKFWRCQYGCYRADGANGQLTVVMPDQDAVLSVHAGLGDMQKELNLIWEHLLPAFANAPLPDDAVAQAALTRRLQTLALKPVKGASLASANAAFFDKTFSFKPNFQTIRSLRLTRKSDREIALQFTTEAGVYQVLAIGDGASWGSGLIRFSTSRHERLGRLTGDQPAAASAAVQADGSLKIRVWMTESAQKIDLSIRLNGKDAVAEGRMSGIGGDKLKPAE